MDFEQVLKTRRSVRKYIERPVEKEKIKSIIEAGLKAPSAHNRQPWEFVVLSSKKDKVADFMYEFFNNDSEKNDSTISRTADVIKNADKLILIYNTSKVNRDHDLLSIGGMIENMLLEATYLGISSLWIANCLVVKEEINKFLNIEDKELVSAVSLGYSLIEPKDLPRKTFDEAVIYEE